MEFSLTSFNVHLNGLHYNKIDSFNLREAIKSLHADIIVLQEVFPVKEINDLPFDIPQGYNFLSHNIGDFHRSRINNFDSLSLSTFFMTKFEIQSHEVIKMKNYGKDPRKSIVKVTLKINNTLIDLYLMHLTIGLLPLGSFLQLLSLRKKFQKSKNAIIVGDFNLWRTMARILIPFNYKIGVRGPSWPSFKPFHQIDNLFLKNLVIQKSSVAENFGSDHLPIQATISYIV